ncbi:DoxX family protein [Aliifodinibius salicampi]|uniref:DoxX family protein n=1 Tax=Fodinibius salicampi TaxID=1920655 RepID=A0ABT3Q0J0_9BACT|nr:DoxX family protein [Fodinibius salicampi]MCW9713551.1 DoxX family protein [Fodinibius salicampi]
MIKKALSIHINSLTNSSLPILVLRLVAGFAIFFNHGLGKLGNVFSGNFQFGDPIGLGPTLSLILVAFAEGICGILVMLGLGTRLASAVLVINFIVIVFVAHAGDPFGDIEDAVLFLTIFITLTLLGGGKYSLDKILFPNHR